MEFVATGPDGTPVEFGRLLLKQDLRLGRMQGFHLHADKPGDHTLSFSVPPQAMETPLVQRIVMVDQLDGLVHLKTYEIGLGDEISLRSDVELRRTKTGHEVKTNVSATVSVGGKTTKFNASPDWQPVDVRRVQPWF